MRKLAWVAGVITCLGCGAYVFVYLYRWEWHRALIMGVFLLSAEVAVATALVLRRLRSVPTAAGGRELDPEVLERIRQGAPHRQHFAWLDPRSGSTNVFITMVVGGGIIISAGAWVIDRFASRTAGRQLEGDLAMRLSDIAFPTEELVADQTELLTDEAPFEHDPDLQLLLGTAPRP